MDGTQGILQYIELITLQLFENEKINSRKNCKRNFVRDERSLSLLRIAVVSGSKLH